MNKNKGYRVLGSERFKKIIGNEKIELINLTTQPEVEYIDKPIEKGRVRPTKPEVNNLKYIGGYMVYSLKTNRSGHCWESLVGYTLEDLKQHLESLFTEGMNWSNQGVGYGKWNIDHIIPKSRFKFNSPNDPEFKECWSLSNLQPLWSSDNIRKKDRIIDTEAEYYENWVE